jgi:hypothetical protein
MRIMNKGLTLLSLVSMDGFGDTDEILRVHMDGASARAVNVSNKEERDGHNKRQNGNQDTSRLHVSQVIAD